MECYDINGTPITHDWWMELMGDDEYRTVARDHVGEVMVSTVWLGLNHNFFPDGEPLIFETMVFGRPDESMIEDDEFTCRYTTLEQAQRGHDNIVDDVIRKYGLPDSKILPE